MNNTVIKFDKELEIIFKNEGEKISKGKLNYISKPELFKEISKYYIIKNGVNDILKSFFNQISEGDKTLILNRLNQIDELEDLKTKMLNSNKTIDSLSIKDTIISPDLENTLVGFTELLESISDKNNNNELPIISIDLLYYYLIVDFNEEIPKRDSESKIIHQIIVEFFRDKILTYLEESIYSVYNVSVDTIKTSEIESEFNDLSKSIISALVQLSNSFDTASSTSSTTTSKDKDSLEEELNKFENYGKYTPFIGTKLDELSTTPFLDSFSVDMTKQAKLGNYDPVIGRESVVSTIIEFLGKRKKANVALIGKAGTGKSTVVERLAQRIASNKVPASLQNKKLYSLNINDLVAGTKYRGEFEERLQKIIKELCSNKDIILYIDELHNLVGSGGNGNSTGDGANILKPYLARGEFKCIGSTTFEEYRRFIEKDSALNRRFSTVEIEEPTKEETIKILEGIKSKYENFHKVSINSDIIKSCVEFSKYITDKNQPDKSIDILDLSCSLASLTKNHLKTINENKKNLENTIKAKVTSIINKDDLVEGKKLRDEELRLKEIYKNYKSEVTVDNVAEAVSKISKIPVDKIKLSDRDKIRKMKKELKKRVIGQDKAIDAVVKKIQYSCLGFKSEEKPIFTGLFVGNTGIGKTLICKEIARIFFGSQDSLIKIDCGELNGEGSVSKLIGTTAGYIGFENSVPLFDAVRRKPSCVLLLDEIEKCNKSVYEIFMNILDEGYCRLGDSTRVDFTNAIIIFTGNVGTQELQKNLNNVGFIENDSKQHRSEKIINKAIKDRFKPEFLNRLDDVIVFNELEKSDMAKIFNIEIDKIKKQLRSKNITIEISKELKELILNKVNYSMGARDLKRLINDYILDSLSDTLSKTEANNFKLSLNKSGNVEIDY